MSNAAYLYVVRQSGTNLFKIGISNDVDYRLATMQTGNPFALEVWQQYEMAGRYMAFSAEAMLHGRFEAKRVQGEWFELGGAELSHIHELMSAFMLGAERMREATLTEIEHAKIMGARMAQDAVAHEKERWVDTLYEVIETDPVWFGVTWGAGDESEFARRYILHLQSCTWPSNGHGRTDN